MILGGFALWLFGMVVHLGASQCVQWRCRPLAVSVCAEWTPSFVWVNIHECPLGLTCSLLDLLPLMTWKPSGTLPCVAAFLPHNSTAMNCHRRDTWIALFAPHVSQCRTDQDCVLWNGGSGKCGCALDGSSYCKVNEGDKEADGFFQACESMSGETAFAWYLFFDLGHMLRRIPWCVRSAFEEISYLRDFIGEQNLTAFSLYH